MQEKYSNCWKKGLCETVLKYTPCYNRTIIILLIGCNLLISVQKIDLNKDCLIFYIKKLMHRGMIFLIVTAACIIVICIEKNRTDHLIIL